MGNGHSPHLGHLHLKREGQGRLRLELEMASRALGSTGSQSPRNLSVQEHCGLRRDRIATHWYLAQRDSSLDGHLLCLP